jgi:hypothetical protein
VLDNLEVVASYECIIDIYIIKCSVVFSHLGFHVNYSVMCICGCLLCTNELYYL